MKKLTSEQKNDIRLSLFEDVKDPDIRQKIMSIALAYSDENGEDGDLEKMTFFLIQNPDRVDDLYSEFVGYLDFDIDESNSRSKKK